MADVTTEQEKQVVATGLVDYELSGFSDKELLLTSERFGNHQLDTAGPTIDTLPAITLSENLQSDTPITIQGRTNWVPYIHQLWSTPEWFNGSWACGPTSSVMAVAHYRLAANRIWVLGQPSDMVFMFQKLTPTMAFDMPGPTLMQVEVQHGEPMDILWKIQEWLTGI
ncbi:MAG: hypothetical protein GFH27_549293n245 [Chloroflexi bacterium AL-W]|nr:hypothetical protein [Chloroflexi bacterium AL-N1]NOK67640.1 hypothetical protein [Chloroflexi bacterium AL-N10]NOK75590.1 hypothetical protein [Chloroflexi bacterium AL-N5]NOK82378.1 hypothetical protein [Chloroflexi bacterium AL-W]NOK90223.1 hypothetical protein [Chloroflexi bacterium AL-N15]